jgi:anaerobic dimethyl sulfoxide reductase subunit B (iron-sulfur subunit)
MRALEFGEINQLVAEHGEVMRVFPLPETSLTDPAVVITPHKEAKRTDTEPTQIANREEI